MPEGFTALRTSPKNPTSKKSAVIGIELSQSLDCDRYTKSQRLVEIVSLQEQLTQQKENLGGGEKCEALHFRSSP